MVIVQVYVPGIRPPELFAFAGSLAEPESATTFPVESTQVIVEFVAPGSTEVALAEMLVSGMSLNEAGAASLAMLASLHLAFWLTVTVCGFVLVASAEYPSGGLVSWTE
jgi:hypothetical protein